MHDLAWLKSYFWAAVNPLGSQIRTLYALKFSQDFFTGASTRKNDLAFKFKPAKQKYFLTSL